MKQEKMTIEERMLGSLLRNELLKISEPEVQLPKQETFKNIEYISTNKVEEESPIMKMNEDQILDFVEMLDAKALSTLSVKELNYIGEVLGVEPQILLGMESLED